MKTKFNKILSVFLSAVLVASLVVVATDNLSAKAVEAVPQDTVGTLAVGESYTFNFNEGEVIETVANTTASVDADGNKFYPFLSQNGTGIDTAAQANIDTNGDGTEDTSALKLSLTGWQSLYVPTDKNGTPFTVEPNTTYKVTVNAYVHSKSAWGQFFAGGGYKSRHEHSTFKSGGMIYDQASVYYDGGLSGLRTNSSTFTTDDFRLSNGKFTQNGLEYNNYLYIYSALCAEKFDGTNQTPSVVYIDSITITKIRSTTQIGETTTFDFDTVNSSTATDAEGNSFSTFATQYPATSGATQANIDTDGDGTAETSALKLSIMGWSNSIFIPTDKNGQPYVIEPNTTYTVTINAYIEAKAGWGQFFIGGGMNSRSTVAYKSGGLIYDVPIIYDGGNLSALRTETSTFTTGDYTLSGNKFTIDGKDYLNYLYIQMTFGQAAFDGTNQAPSVVYVDSVTVTKTSQTVTATFDANGGSFADSTTSVSAAQNVGEAFTVEAPTSEAGTFAGWSYTADGMPTNKVTSAMHGQTLYAIYKTPVNVTLNANSGKFADSSASMVTTQFEGVYLYYDIPTNGTDKFLGWATAPTADRLESYKVTADMEGTTLYALWEKDPHGSYETFERYIDYSSYTVNAWSGGNSWYTGDTTKYPWFTLVSDETADGGKYLRFNTPHDDDPAQGLTSDWLGSYGITMTASGNYNASGSGDENLYLPENTSYRVTLKLRTVELSNSLLQLYVGYGDKHHTAYYQTQTLLSNIGESNEWTEISAVFTTPAAYTNGNLCFIGLTVGGDVPFEYHLDSVKLERVTATNLYTVKNGTPTLEKTLYGVPGTDLDIPEYTIKEFYDDYSSVGGTAKTTFGKLYSDKNFSAEAILKFANCDVNLYCKEAAIETSSVTNQEGYCGFDSYCERQLNTAFNGEVISITDKEAFTGQKSLRADLTSDNTGVFEIRNAQDISVSANKTYKVSFAYKTNKDITAKVGVASPEGVLNGLDETVQITLNTTNEWKMATLNICADLISDEYALGMELSSSEETTVYIDNVSVWSGVSVAGTEKTNDNTVRFVMSYIGETETVIEGETLEIEERGILIKGEDNPYALTIENTAANKIRAVTQNDLSVNWAKFVSSDTTLYYSAAIKGLEADSDYKLSARGYLKLKNGDVYYTDIITTSAADIDADNSPLLKTVLCIGDDLTYGQGSDSYPDYIQKWGGKNLNVINAGYNNAQLAGSDAYLNTYGDKITSADIVLIMLGTNDVTNDWESKKESVESELKKLVDAVKAKNENADIYICTSPYRTDSANTENQLELVQIQKNFADENGLKLIDVYTAMEEAQDLAQRCVLSTKTLYKDSVSLNANGRAILAKTIYNAIKDEYGSAEISDERYAALEAPAVYTYPEDKEIIENTVLFGDGLWYGYVDGTRAWQGIAGIEYAEYKNYPNSGKTEGGRLWATWYSGGKTESDCSYVVLATSDDEGATWSDARVIIDPDNVGPVRAYDPVLWIDPNNRMWIFWNQEYGTYTLDGQKSVWAMYTDDPYSMDPVWSSPVRLCNGIMMNKPTVITDENNEQAWILPAYTWFYNYMSDPAEIGPNLYKFVGYDKPWETYSKINGKEEIVAIDSFAEHMLIQNPDKLLRVIVRTSQGLKEVISTDYGKSWSAASAFENSDGSVMSVTDSRHFIRTIMDADGKITGNTQILIYHDNTTALRANLTVALSEDGGKTWSHKIEIESASACSYPDAVQASDGTLYITYDLNRYSTKKIALARITVEDIKAGSIVSDNSVLRLTINNN